MSTYRPLDATALTAHLATLPALSARLGGSPESWTAREVSDGNLNTVFIVSGPAGSLCCKQSLPYVRVDPGWAMPLERTLFEARWMQTLGAAVGHQIPALLHLDEGLFLIVMEDLSTHKVLRTALIEGDAPAGFSARIGEFVGHAGFATSWRARPFEDLFALREVFARNLSLTRITVDLVMTDPYRQGCARNRWLSPALDSDVAEIQSDSVLHAGVTRLQERFLGTTQALLHGDLHTGSVMVHNEDVRVIDGEFAIFGPLGFDLGMFIANLVMNGYALPDRESWMQDEISLLWSGFCNAYRQSWDGNTGCGDVGSLATPEETTHDQDRLFREVMRDCAGFAGLELIRRTMGFAQAADFAAAPDTAWEAEARRRALHTGRRLIVKSALIEDIEALLDAL